MTQQTIAKKYENIIKKNSSLLCIGLDPELSKLPPHLKTKQDPIFEFNKGIVDATNDLVCAYKPNIAFYEAEGLDGLRSLKKTIEYIQKNYPEIPIILDAKRADIPNTAHMYAQAAFEYWKADAVTVYPHLGLDALLPFFEYQDKLTILLIKTSNPDSEMFQDVPVKGKSYYLTMARKISTWRYDNFGIFVGATYPKELQTIRSIFPDKIFLSAGLGAQKAEIKKAVAAGIDKNKRGVMFNASRSIIYAFSGKNFAEVAQQEAEKLRSVINEYRI